MREIKCRKSQLINVGIISAKDAKDAKELIFMLSLSHCEHHFSMSRGSNDFIEPGYWVRN